MQKRPHILLMERRKEEAVPVAVVREHVRKSLEDCVSHGIDTACIMFQSSCKRRGFSIRESAPLFLVLTKSLTPVGQARRFVVSTLFNPDIEVIISTREGRTDASLRVIGKGEK